MTIVTLTSDWNQNDYYLGALKGRLASISFKINLLEIANFIPSFDVLKESFVLKSVFRHFPAGTIHLMGVMSEPLADSPMVIVYAQGHYFIGVNDGRFSHLFDSPPSMAFAINDKEIHDSLSTFKAISLFAKGVNIILENSFEQDTVACDLISESVMRVAYDSNQIVGKVLYIDSFGNVITNIERETFEKVHRGRSFTIYVDGPHIKIFKISQNYEGHNNGEIFAVFNSLSLLELGMYIDSIAQRENISYASEVRIIFKNE